jgi:hypothetical protein
MLTSVLSRDQVAAVEAIQRGLESVTSEQRVLQACLRELAERVDALAAGMQTLEIGDMLERQLQVLRAIVEDEPGNRRRLWALRESPEYQQPFVEEDPLVTVWITTYTNAEALAARSIPSVLAQTHENLELLVVGDAAPPEVEEAVRSFDDPRVRFVNLGIRGPYPDDPVRQWLVAGTAPTNEGLRLARGQWLAMNCDDDVFTKDHVELLLSEARRRRLEVVYGRVRELHPDGHEQLLCRFPPERAGDFGIQAALLHRGLRMFSLELVTDVFGDPGDWAWIRRMVRLGVRIGMIDKPVVDYYPSNLWGSPVREPGTLDGWDDDARGARRSV